MMPIRAFLYGFLIGLFIVIAAGLLAAHLLSDCGLPAVLGIGFCADSIVRVGFPLVFFEQGGFAYRSGFNLPYLLFDLFSGLTFSGFCGFITNRVSKQRSKK